MQLRMIKTEKEKFKKHKNTNSSPPDSLPSIYFSSFAAN